MFGRGDLAAADDALDAVSHGPGVPPLVGTDGIKRQPMLLRTAIPDLRSVLHKHKPWCPLEGTTVARQGTHA